MLTKNSLIEKGFKVTQKIENADMILYGGCESSDIQSVVTLLLIDEAVSKVAIKFIYRL